MGSPFPHFIAYENLVASCNGYIPDEGKAKCCNNKRGDFSAERPVFDKV